MKLLCKKGLKGIINDEYDGITPGKYYIFYCFDPNVFDYYCEDDMKNHLWFTTNNKNSSWYIWDYFYTPQQTRKLKLQKINETTL